MTSMDRDETELRSDIQRPKAINTSQTGNRTSTPRDRFWCLVILFASFMCNIVVGIRWLFWLSFLWEFEDHSDESLAKISLIYQVSYGTTLLVDPIVSGLINKFGCRPICMAGGIVSATAFILARFSPNVDVFILTYGFMGGLGFGMIYLPSVISVGFYFVQYRGVATGIALCGWSIVSTIFGSFISEILSNRYHWKTELFIMSGIAFSACVFGALLRPLMTRINNVEVSETVNGQMRQDIAIGSTGVEIPLLEVTGQVEETSKTSDNTECPTHDLEPPSGGFVHEIQPLVRHTTNHSTSCSQPDLRSGRGINISGSRNRFGQEYVSRPLQRKDSFNGDSIHHAADINPECRDTNNVATLAEVSINEITNSSSQTVCPCIPRSIIEIFAGMLDVSLLTNVGFLCICLGNILSMAGFLVSPLYIIHRAFRADTSNWSVLSHAIGITGIVGRISFGLLADLKFVNSLLLNNLCMSVAGVAILLTTFAESYAALTVATVAFGLMSGIFISLSPVVLCDLLGLGKLTNAFGLVSMARGIGYIIGIFLHEISVKDTEAAILGGSLFLVGTLFHFVPFLPCLKSRRMAKVELDTAPSTNVQQINEEQV